ncbi:hypothetical protein HBI55_139880 [Parastagonospora nodorum]|nr:hypothetical protein HBI55_139880 [Parastagonospora nodorum]
MDLKKELVQVDEEEIGLDRANITSDNQIQLPTLDNSSSSSTDTNSSPTQSRSSSHLVNSLRDRKHHAAVKIRKTLHISKPTDDIDSASPILANTAEETSDSRLDHNLPVPDKHSVKEILHHPIDAVKSKVGDQGNHEVAANIAAKEIPHGDEVDLVNAHDKVGNARTEKERVEATDEVKRLMKDRQSKFARWSLDRHVTKIRVLPREGMKRRERREFEKRDAEGGVVVDWRGYASHLLVYYAHQYGGQYIGYGSDPPTPSKETLMPNIERLIVATSPFQEFIMTTRRVYRWESPAETSKYLLIYLLLWYLNLLLPGILSAVLYLILERRLHGNTLEDLRADIQHAESTHETALSLTEFITKRGDDKWADEIVQVVGPWLMVQLADMANFFESVRNFYEWRKPARTASTLAVLFLLILATALTPVWLLIKTATFAMGVTFFAVFPLATNFPEYRLLLSPTKRLLWNIPTHAEWAIRYVQAEGSRVAASHTPDPSAIPLKTSPAGLVQGDYGFYTAHHESSAGHLVISKAACRFVSNVGHKMHFTLAYSQISRIEKEDRIVAKKVPGKIQSDSGLDLKLVLSDGNEYVLGDMRQRDEAFSQILGFSATVWQVVW